MGNWGGGREGITTWRKPYSRTIYANYIRGTWKCEGNPTYVRETPYATNEYMERPPLAREGKYQLETHPDTHDCLKHIQREKLTTRIIPNGKQRSQIDYIMVNQGYRNDVIKTMALPGWGGNSQQKRHHTWIKMELALKSIRNYYHPYQRETGET